MLKKIQVLFLGLVVLVGSACVTPTHASSASSVVLTHVRAGSTASPLEELIVVHNNSAVEVNVTGWCVSNKAHVNFACFDPEVPLTELFLPPFSSVSIASTIMAETRNPNDFALIYSPPQSTSGSLVASSDTISLHTKEGEVVDQFSWGAAISTAQYWTRILLGTIYADTDTAADWERRIYQENYPVSQLVVRDAPPEEPELPVDPEDPELPDDSTGPSQPQNPPAGIAPLLITELLPNAVGSDTGNEFIEIYNPNMSGSVALSQYRLTVGLNLEKIINFPVGLTIGAGEYRSFSNSELSFSLVNTAGRVTLISLEQNNTVSDVQYVSPPEGESWALINQTWQYTNLVTPGAANPDESDISKNQEDAADESVAASAPIVKPCAANQYRSPETNRCRLISSAASASPAACKVGQVRNPDTGRCKALATAAAQTPCKAGQERNAETNRCRNVKAMTKAGHAVKGASTQQQGGTTWYMWAAIVGVVVAVLGYAAWEWRVEVLKLCENIRGRFARRTN